MCQILYHKILCVSKFYEKKRKKNKCPWNIFCAAKKMQKHFGNFSRRMCRTKRVKLQYEQELFAGTKRIQEIDWSYLCVHLGWESRARVSSQLATSSFVSITPINWYKHHKMWIEYGTVLRIVGLGVKVKKNSLGNTSWQFVFFYSLTECYQWLKKNMYVFLRGLDKKNCMATLIWKISNYTHFKLYIKMTY